MDNLLKVLIVDDAAEIREILRIHLMSWNYAVVEAGDGGSALVAVNMEKPDLIILDYFMPKMDGLSVLEKIRDLKNDVPVIMLTTNPEQNTAVQCFRKGADDFVAKPFDPDFLEIVVKRTLKLRDTERKLNEFEVINKPIK
jgi:DNA-binding response OmpR family regulator